MYTILVIITSKWKITTLLVFEKISFERWEVYYVRCQGLRHKSAGIFFFIFPTTLDRLRMYCLSQYLTSDIIKLLTFSFWQQKAQSFIHSAIQVQVTDTLESQFWGICFFSWHSTKKKLQKVSNISITAKYDNVINVTWQCNNYWRFYISLQLQV